MTTALGLSEHLVNSTVRIACSKKDGGTSIGTGCLVNFRRPDTAFVPTLVTNRHVIENCMSGTFFLTEIDSEGNPQFGVSHPCALPDFETNWIAHPDPSVDLCAMPLGGLVNSSDQMGQSFRGFEGHMLASRERLQQLAALDRVITIGYPCSAPLELDRYASSYWTFQGDVPWHARDVPFLTPSRHRPFSTS